MRKLLPRINYHKWIGFGYLIITWVRRIHVIYMLMFIVIDKQTDIHVKVDLPIIWIILKARLSIVIRLFSTFLFLYLLVPFIDRTLSVNRPTEVGQVTERRAVDFWSYAKIQQERPFSKYYVGF